MSCRLSADDTFGPVVKGCRDDFDFTLLFEQSIFQIGPCALLLLSVPWRTSSLLKQDVKTARSRARVLKQAAIIALASTQLALLILWSTTPMFRTRASVPAATLSFLASLTLLALSSFEHSRSVRPSTLINIYLLFSLLFDLPQARTLWLRPGPRSLPGVFTGSIAAKASVLVLESRSKRSSLFSPYSLYAPEALVSLINRTFLWWLNPLLFRGFRSVISFEFLYPIDDGLQSEKVEGIIQRRWTLQNKKSKHSLLWACWSALLPAFLSIVPPRLCYSALRLSQPLLINRVTTILSHGLGPENRNQAKGLIGAAVLVYIGLAICNATYKRQLHRFMVKLRGGLISTIYTKTLILSSDKLADNASLTLFSTDVERIMVSLERVDEMFATPLEIIVAIYLLASQIGVSCIAPAGLSILISLISFWNSNHAVPIQKKYLQAISERVSYTSAVLGCPKGFKMLGLTDFLSDRVQALRVHELAAGAAYRKFVTWRNVFGHIPQCWAPTLTLMIFTLTHGGYALNPTIAFTTLSLIALVTLPIQELIFAVPFFQQALASLDRIQAFLLLEESGPSIEERASLPPSPTGLSLHGEAIELQVLPNKSSADDRSLGLLHLKDGAVRLGIEQKVILRDINLSVQRATLTMLVGPVGSGKSTLLKVLAGDIGLSDGTLDGIDHISGTGYCAQEPWLPNGKLRDLIAGQSEFEEAWFRVVVQACALDADMASLDDGDQTVVGSKGVTLSGGQRQRVALARALYARKRVLVVDDTLSGLDARTSRHVFDRVFGPRGLCKQHAIGVVLATHAIQFLPQADQILVLESGSVSSAGTFSALRSELQHLHLAQSQDHEVNDDGVGTSTAAQATAPKASPASEDMEAQQDIARRTGDTAVYAYYFRSIGWRYGSLIALTTITFGCADRLSVLWVRWWSESHSEGQPLSVWIAVYYLFNLIASGSVGFQIWVMLIWTVPKSSAYLHKMLLNAVMRAKYAFFVKTDAGITLNRFSRDLQIIDGQLAGALMQTTTGAALSLVSAGLILAGSKYSAAVIPILVAVLYAIQKFYLRTSRQLRFMELEAQAPLVTQFQETNSGIATIRAFGWQSRFHQQCLERLDLSQRPYYLLLCIQRWLNLVLDLVTASMATIVVAFAMTVPNTSSAGSLGVAMLNVLSFGVELAFLIQSWTMLETSLGAIARIKNFQASTPKEDKVGENETPSKEWPQAGGLVFRNVSAAYTDDGEDVLKSLTFSIAPGEKVGICGRTGSGKSSTLLALMRLLDYHTGSIVLDGLDLEHIPRQVIRERLTALPQEAIIVPGTVQENMDPTHSTSNEAIRDALEKVGLLEKVDSLGGIETSMDALALSHGQMQLFAVARALLRKSKVLVLDEMTSAVDAHNEQKIVDIIREEFVESTVLAVAHRLKTLEHFDKVLVMDGGRIVEAGSPRELLRREGGLFRALWERAGH